MNKKAIILTLVLALPASLTLAQRPGGPPPGGQPPRGPAPGRFPPGPPPRQQPGGENGQPRGDRQPNPDFERERPHKPPLMPGPLLHVLDTDHDGIIAAAEIEKAPDSLLTLDRNKDGKLMPDELRGPKPGGQPPGGGDRKEGERPFPGQKPPRDGENRIEEPFRPKGEADRRGEFQRRAGEGAKKENERPFPGQKPPRQDDNRPEGPLRPKDGDDRGEPPRPPVPPLIAALDADRNGVISAEEIAASAKALLTLDRNGDGQLGPGEYMGRPHGEPREGDGPKPPPQEPAAE